MDLGLALQDLYTNPYRSKRIKPFFKDWICKTGFAVYMFNVMVQKNLSKPLKIVLICDHN
jgi:hypothetical protein